METIFVGNLSYFCTNKSLFDLFSTVGPVQAAMVRKSRRNQPLHYGFVEMTEKDAIKALEVMNNRDFMGRKLRVALRRGISDDMAPQLHFHSIHLSFVTSDTDILIDEGFLIHAFSHFGGLEDCVVKQHVLSKRRQKQGGYAFLYFKDQQSAENVIEEVKYAHGKLGNILYDAKLSCTSPSGPEASTDANSLEGSQKQRANNRSMENAECNLNYLPQVSVPFHNAPTVSNPNVFNNHNLYHPTIAPTSVSLDTVLDSPVQPTWINTTLSDSSFSTPSSSFYHNRSPSAYPSQNHQLAKQALQSFSNPSISSSTSGKSVSKNSASHPNSGSLTPMNSFHIISSSTSAGETPRHQFSHAHSNTSSNSSNNLVADISRPDSHQSSPQIESRTNHLNSPHHVTHPLYQHQNPSVPSSVYGQHQPQHLHQLNSPVYMAPSMVSSSSQVVVNNSTTGVVQSLTLPPTASVANTTLSGTHPSNCGCHLCFQHSSNNQINPTQRNDTNQSSSHSSIACNLSSSQQHHGASFAGGDANSHNYPSTGHLHAIPPPQYYYYPQTVPPYQHPSLYSPASYVPQTAAPIIYYTIPHSPQQTVPSTSMLMQDGHNNPNHQIPAPHQRLSISSMSPSMAPYYPQPYPAMPYPAPVPPAEQMPQHFSTANNSIHSSRKSTQNNHGHNSVSRSNSGSVHPGV